MKKPSETPAVGRMCLDMRFALAPAAALPPTHPAITPIGRDWLELELLALSRLTQIGRGFLRNSQKQPQIPKQCDLFG